MKKLIFEKTGLPKDVLQLQELPIPTPKANEVLVKVKAAPINPSDTMFVQGLYGLRPELPSGAGFEGAGTVEAVGEGVELPLGTTVSFAGVGAWAEYIIVPANSVIPLPPNIPFEVAAQVFVNPFTAWAMLHESKLQAGDWLLLTAGGSSFAQLVIQMATRKGIKTICTVRRDDQIEQLKQLGATEVVNTAKDFLPKKVKTITDGKFANVCFDATGGELGGLALQSLAVGGTIWVYGMMSQQETPLHNGIVLFKNLTVKGFWLSTWLPNAPKEVRKEAAQTVIGMLARKELQTSIEATYPLANFQEALQHNDKEARRGKVLLSM